MMVLYGLATCDTCRKALAALKSAGHEVRLHDVRSEPLLPAQIAGFLACFGDRLVNRASTTWRGLSDSDRKADPATLLATHPAVMKRPVIDARGRLHLGFGPEVRAALLK